MTRLRKLTVRQGKLQEIADVFIRSLLHNKLEGQSNVHFIETLFCVRDRHIVFARVAHPFDLDGETFFVGTRLIVRHDETTPDLYELATLSDADNVSKLTRAQWNQVRTCIELTDKKARHGAEKFFGLAVTR